MKALKLWSVLQERIAIPVFSFSLPKYFLIEYCHLQVSLSNSAGTFRFDFGGMTGMMSRSIKSVRSQSASNALSASRCPAAKPRISVFVPRKSWACPGSRRKSTRFPRASVRASIFVVMPPRERPMAWQ